MDKKRVFGELELAIFRLFEGGERLTVRGVLDKLQGKDKYTTVMTVMTRMADKRVLLRERVGQQYEYWVNESDSAPQSSLLEKLKDKLFGGKSVSMVSYLIESSDMSEKDLEEMEQLIQKLKEARKDG